MPEVVGIRFKPCGKIYEFDINGINVKPGIWVVVESEMGLSIGLIVKARHNMEPRKQQFKKVLRTATVRDLESDRNNRSLEDKAKAFCMEKVKKRSLLMKVVGVEATLDRKRLIFYFTADGRIDFRELVRDLASKFKTRIEMRQIGVRDEIKFIGGIGVCGREVCCKVFLSSFAPVSIRMAKKQELVLNPSKLSGICGRLMCCLGYELGGETAKKVELGPKAEKAKKALQVLEIEETVVAASDAPETKKPAETRGDIKKDGGRGQKQPEKPRGPEPGKRHGKPHAHHAKDKKEKDKKDKGKPFSRRKKFWKKKKKKI